LTNDAGSKKAIATYSAITLSTDVPDFDRGPGQYQYCRIPIDQLTDDQADELYRKLEERRLVRRIALEAAGSRTAVVGLALLHAGQEVSNKTRRPSHKKTEVRQ
jgi:hypothetical protein